MVDKPNITKTRGTNIRVMDHVEPENDHGFTMKDKEALMIVRRAIMSFMEIDRDMTLNRLESLLATITLDFTAMEDLREHAEKTYGLTKSGLSRMVSYWGDDGYIQYRRGPDGENIPYRPDGAGFLTFYTDVHDRRRRNIKVTPEGHAFASHLIKEIKEGSTKLAQNNEN